MAPEMYDEMRSRQNKLFMMTSHTREQYGDTQILKELGRIAVKEGAKIGDSWRRYDFDALAEGLRNNFTEEGGEISWVNLGKDVGSSFLSVPTFSCMFGPIGKEEVIKQHKPRNRAAPVSLGCLICLA